MVAPSGLQHSRTVCDKSISEMNSNLPERFRRGSRNQQFNRLQSQEAQAPASCSPAYGNRLRKYFKPVTTSDESEQWISAPEFPQIQELVHDDSTTNVSHLDENDINITDQPWESKAKYLKTHYKLLREDALRPLREALSIVIDNPQAMEPTVGSVGIYDDVHIKGITFSNRGLGVKVSFSLRRVGKQIKWNQSKRLVSSSLVVLIPASFSTTSSFIVATVAARPPSGLEQEPPEIDLFFARPWEYEIDPQVKYVMVEDRSGFFEAQRYTLRALQKMMQESFPMSEHVVKLQENVSTSKYLQAGTIASPTGLQNAGMDESQQAALQRIVSKRLALIQGPPGTGKTYVSTQALEIMMRNDTHDQPPIVIACQTNHALDQILRQTALVTNQPECYIRLGSRSTDPEVRKRTLFELRPNLPAPRSNTRGAAMKNIKDLTKRMKALLEPFQKGSGALSLEYFQQIGILSEDQCTSIRESADKWQSAGTTSEASIEKWLGPELKPFVLQIPRCIFPEVEEADLDLEELNEEEAEQLAKSDDEYDMLNGDFITLGDDMFGSAGKRLENIEQMLLNTQAIGKVKPGQRGAVYNYLVKRAKGIAVAKFRKLGAEYSKAVEELAIGRWEEDASRLSRFKIIGMTTTGFSKYRPLLDAVQPKIVLIEEAAEIIEAPVTATCIESLEHLILVGDHKQLRPHCQARELEDLNLNISLFERLVSNNVEFSSLNHQRRMIPAIRGLLLPVYGDSIQDHPRVRNELERPLIPGMGNKSTWFYHHTGPEAKDDQLSYFNDSEAVMIVEFCRYLLYNGMPGTDITILTFYNGQKRRLSFLFRRRLGSPSSQIKIVTVDSYQGEENGVVILSLVRNNMHGNIGFLAVENRVCVALSRAQRGLYIFGNGELLSGESRIWCQVMKIMRRCPQDNGDRRIGFTLPLQCQKHHRKTWIRYPEDWAQNAGGCDLKCMERMPCGHQCVLLCHPTDSHDCQTTCGRTLPCQHRCTEYCIEPCRCRICEESYKDKADHAAPPSSKDLGSQKGMESESDGRASCDSHHLTSTAWKSVRNERLTEQVHGDRDDRACFTHHQSEFQNGTVHCTVCGSLQLMIDESYQMGQIKNVQLHGLVCTNEEKTKASSDPKVIQSQSHLLESEKMTRQDQSHSYAANRYSPRVSQPHRNPKTNVKAWKSPEIAGRKALESSKTGQGSPGRKPTAVPPKAQAFWKSCQDARRNEQSVTGVHQVLTATSTKAHLGAGLVAWRELAEDSCKNHDERVFRLSEESSAQQKRLLLDELNYSMLFADDVEESRTHQTKTVEHVADEAGHIRFHTTTVLPSGSLLSGADPAIQPSLLD